MSVINHETGRGNPRVKRIVRMVPPKPSARRASVAAADEQSSASWSSGEIDDDSVESSE